jgi:hypothetical protein
MIGEGKAHGVFIPMELTVFLNRTVILIALKR